MKILIAAGNYPKLSESYIEAEISFLLRGGHQVAVYSPQNGSPEAPERVPVFRSSIRAAIEAMAPDVLHAHYLHFDLETLRAAGAMGVPVTVRGHSFDFSAARGRALCDFPFIRRVWLFPHFAAQVQHAKVAALPVAFDSTLYTPANAKERRLVYRAAAGKSGKGLPDFFEAAQALPAHRFRLAANVVLGEESYLKVLRALAAPTKVEYLENVQRRQAVDLMLEAGIYLDTSDPKGHAFGMPISIAEAMATGCYVLARRAPGLDDYLGGAGGRYSSVAEAVQLIRATIDWTDAEWARQAHAATASAERFRDDAVLPGVVSFWETL